MTSRRPSPYRTGESPDWSRRRLLQAMMSAGVLAPIVAPQPAIAKPVKHAVHLKKQFNNLPLIALKDLQPGDVLHLRVNCIFTSYHSVRKVINQIQHFMLTSASRSPESVYYSFFHQYRQRELPADDPIIGVDSDADTIRDLTDTGHTTIYIGDGLVVETTGIGAQVRRWAAIDTARYVVMRAKNPVLQNAIHDFAVAIAGSVRASEVKQRLLDLSTKLPPDDATYIHQLSAVSSSRYITDKYDKVSGSKGFFGKLKVQYTLESPTALDTMLYHDGRNPPLLHRDTICSSLAALVICLAERSIGWESIGRTFDSSAMSEVQRTAFEAQQAGIGTSIHVRPEHVLPAYLQLGMKLSNQYEVLGQFINIGSASNKNWTGDEPLEVVRPHARYIEATRTFVDGLSWEQAACIQLPIEEMRQSFKVIGHGKLPHRRDLADSRAIYQSILRRHDDS